jgi:competence protein ComEC
VPTALLLWGFAYCLGVFLGDGCGVRWEASRVLLGASGGALLLALGSRRWHGWALLLLAFSIGVTAQARRPVPLDLAALRHQLDERSAARTGPGRLAPGPPVLPVSPVSSDPSDAPRPSDELWRCGGQVLDAPQLAAGGTLVRMAIDELGREAAPPSLWPIRPAFTAHVLVRGGLREPLAPGDRVRLRAALHLPLGRRNPGALDAQRLALGRDIAAYASVLPDALVRWQAGPALSTPLARAELSALRRVAWLRERLHAAVTRGFSSQSGLEPAIARERAALLLAVALGERGALQQADAEREQRGLPTLEGQFRAAGVAHVLSVSGLHLSVATWLCFVALAWALRQIAWLAQRCEVRRLAAAAAVPLAIFYTALTGAALPTVRALGAACLGLAALALGRRARPAEGMVAAVLWLVLPWHAGSAALLCFEPSLQLSVAATWALAFLRPLGGLPAGFGPARDRLGARALAVARRTLWRLTEGSTAAMLATLPLCALYFSSVQGATLLGNLLVVPLIELGVLPAGLLGAAIAAVHPGLGDPLLALAGLGAACSCALAAKLAQLGWEIVVPAPPALVLGLWGLGLLALLGRRRLGWLLLGAAIGLLVLLTRSPPGRLVLTALDVGQGDGVVIELPRGGVLVVDAGLRAGLRPGDADAGRSVVAPFLRRRGHRRIDVLLASHPHPDHIGGILTLLEQFEVGELWTAASACRMPSRADRSLGRASSEALWAEVLALAARRGVAVTAPRTGMLGGASIHVLGPCLASDPALPCRAAARPGLGHNDNSIVLRLGFAGRAVLLPGDIEGPGELALLARGGLPADPSSLPAALSPSALLRADVLKAPHHCSRTSSSEALLASVRPQAVICSVGQGNRFGFPHPDVVARYQAHGVAVLRTDRDGAIQVTVRASGALEIATTVVSDAAAAETTAIRSNAQAP